MPAEVVEQVEASIDEVEQLNASIQNDEPVEFDDTQRQRHGNDIYLPARTNPTEDAKVYEMVIGRHPDEREVRGIKAAFKKPKYRKMSERALRLQKPQLLDLFSSGRGATALHEDSGPVQR